MRLTLIRWLAAGSGAIILHSLLLVAWQTQSEGMQSRPAGPSMEMADSVAGILGESVEIEAETEAPKEIAPDEPVENAEMVEKPDELAPSQVEPHEADSVELAATAPVDPAKELAAEPDLPTLEKQEPEKVESTLVPRPAEKPTKQIKEKRAEQQRKAKKPAKATKRDKGKRQAGRRGTGRQGGSGSRNRSGGGGSGRASPGAIASFKSQVRARIASCARSRLSGRGGGRVVIRFSVSSGGGARGVSASGTPSLQGAAASAARGCSFPSPPKGASGLSFAFPVTVR